MDIYNHGKIIGEGDKKLFLKPLVDRDVFISQSTLFILCMKSNACAAMLPPFDVNPLTKVGRILNANNILTQNFGEFLKLVELVVVHVLEFVEDEWLFSIVGFLKSKLYNNFEEQIQVVVGMYVFSKHIHLGELFLPQGL